MDNFNQNKSRPNSNVSSASLPSTNNIFPQTNHANNFTTHSYDQNRSNSNLVSNVVNMPQQFMNQSPHFRNFLQTQINRPSPPVTNTSGYPINSFRPPPPQIGLHQPISIPNFQINNGQPFLKPAITLNAPAPTHSRPHQTLSTTHTNIPPPIYPPPNICRPPTMTNFMLPHAPSIPVMNRPPIPQHLPPPNFVSQPTNIHQHTPLPYLNPPPAGTLQSLTTPIAQFPGPPHQARYTFQSEIPNTQNACLATNVVKSIEEVDKEWIRLWSSNKKGCKAQPESQNISVKQAKVTLKEALETLGDLRAAIGFLSNSLQADEAMWNFKLRKAIKAKEKLIAMRSQFNPATSHFLKMRLKKISRKRSRHRRHQLHVKENKKLKLQESELLHLDIDAWRKGIQDKVLEQKKKEELKCEADNILSEVRKKLQDGRKVLEHLDLLEKLRSVRLENSEKKGLKVSGESTERFEATVMNLREIMTQQLTVYEAEERALKVMLESEREQERHDEQRRKVSAFDRCCQESLLRLFGTPPDPSSPLYFYWQFHMQGSSNVDALIQIRHQWDSFLGSKDDPLASPIPLGWILPLEPSSATWKSALASDDENDVDT